MVATLLAADRGRSVMDALSAREREVLALMAEGLSNRSIAERLVLTERTIETHTGHVFRKLGLNGDMGGHRRVLAVLAHLGVPGTA